MNTFDQTSHILSITSFPIDQNLHPLVSETLSNDELKFNVGGIFGDSYLDSFLLINNSIREYVSLK